MTAYPAQISAAVTHQETGNTMYRLSGVPKCSNTVKLHTMRSRQVPRMVSTAGSTACSVPRITPEGDFVKTAERLERQNVQDPHACRCKDGGIRRKNGRSRRMPERQGHCEERTEACRTADAEPQHPPAAF